jgi:hypothetical protein
VEELESCINDRISELFFLVKAGDYTEPLWEIMTRIKREIELEYCDNARPWYPFAYHHTPSDGKIVEHIRRWKKEHDGKLPPRIDVLFSPSGDGDESWKKGCRHRIPPREDIKKEPQTKSWKFMNTEVDGSKKMPDHYRVWSRPSRKYYALLIENLMLFPYECMETLGLENCRTYPNGEHLRPSTINVCQKTNQDQEGDYRELEIIGRAVLREPFAVELSKQPT